MSTESLLYPSWLYPEREKKYYPVLVKQKNTNKKEEKEIIEVALGTNYDLTKKFPTSKMYTLRVSLGWILASIISAFFYFFAVHILAIFEPGSIMANINLFLVLTIAVCAIAKLIYSEIYRRFLKYRIEDFRLIVSRGIFFKKVGSIPFSLFAEVYVKQNLIDWIIGVYEFHLMLALDPTREFTRIEGLSKNSAFGLKKFITEFVSRQVYVPEPGQKISVGVTH